MEAESFNRPLLIDQVKLPRNADTVEVASLVDRKSFGFDDVAICGCYEYDDTLKRRLGCLAILSIEEDSLVNKFTQSFDSFGVLDSKWTDQTDIVTACSDGCVRMYELSSTDQCNSSLGLLEKWNLSLPNENRCSDQIILSVDCQSNADWSKDCIVCACDSGSVFLIDTGSQSCSALGKHLCEAWACAFDKTDSSIIYSGGDDCYLFGWDTRSPSKVLKIAHPSGVCGIQTDDRLKDSLFTGCYDDKLRVFDKRLLKESTLTSKGCDESLLSFNVGGGPWRLKFNPVIRDLMGIAAMYEGYKFLRRQDSLTEKFFNPEETNLLAYGFDWCKRDPLKFLTCSFYDRIVSLWKIENSQIL